MPTDGLISVYTSFDVTAALLLISLLEDRGVVARMVETGPGGGPYGPRNESRVMVLSEDLRAHSDEIAAAVRDMEAELYGAPEDPGAPPHHP
jgi:hypothetical protein